ncbi:MAG: hypothetical protein FWD53_08910 [Phycisphaerales bacterium]|nr:hypothetical protein [Phycisphaerales bacterium]
MMKLAGIILGLAFVVAWAAVFVPAIWGRATLALRVVALSIAYVVCYLVTSRLQVSIGLMLEDFWLIAGIIDAAVIAGALCILDQVLAIVSRTPKSPIPTLSILFLFATLWAPAQLHGLAWRMWADSSGSLRHREFEMAGIHLFIICFALFLSFAMWVTYRRSPRVFVGQAVAVVASLVLAAIAFAWTIPRLGDMGGGVPWLFLLPAALLVGAFTVLTVIVTLILSLVRESRLRDDQTCKV